MSKWHKDFFFPMKSDSLDRFEQVERSKMKLNCYEYPLIYYLDLDISLDESLEKPLTESMTIEPDITSRMNHSTNPWNVSDASVFLKYCCPECDYINLSLPEFSDHALENHAQSIALFDPTDNQGYRNRYNLVDCGYKKEPCYVF